MSRPDHPEGPGETEALIEAAAGAWRSRGPDGIRSHRAWHDLDAPGQDFGELDGEQAAEPAALLVRLPRHERGPGAAQEGRGLLPQAEAPQGVAAVVEHDAPPAQAAPQLPHAQPLDEELRQLPRARREVAGRRAQREVVEQLAVVRLQHGRA